MRGKDGWKLTLHAMVISGVDAWVTANKNIAKNLSSYGGAYNGALIDSAVQEYDLETGKLLRTWDALEHIPLGDSRATVPTNGFPWDAYHVNAIDLTGEGTFLVSMRNTWAAYMVNIETGKIEWTLGGRHSSYKFGPNAEFQWQHDVALGAGGHTDLTVTMFDDHCCQLTGGGTSVPATGPSRGLVLELDQQTHTATMLQQYTGDDEFESEYMGDTQPLANGNTFVGWGSEPYFTEYRPSGKRLLEAHFPGNDLSYRSMREPWVGVPLTSPSAAAAPEGRQDDRVRQLERRHPGRLLEGPGWRAPTGRPSCRAPPSPASRRRSPCRAATRASRCRRSTRRQGDRNFLARSRVRPNDDSRESAARGAGDGRRPVRVRLHLLHSSANSTARTRPRPALPRALRRLQPGRGLARAGHPGRLPEHADQLPRPRRHARLRRARRRLAQRHARGRAARLLDRDRRKLPAGARVRRGRAREGHRQGHRRLGLIRGEHRASRSPTRRRSARKSSRSTRATPAKSSTTARRRR